MKLITNLHRVDWFDEKKQVIVCVMLIGIMFIYQLTKSLFSFHYDNNLGAQQNFNSIGCLSFVLIALLIIVLTPKVIQFKNKGVITLLIIGFSLALSISYTYMNNFDWSGRDEAQDSYALSIEAQYQGAANFIATYNDRANPGLPGLPGSSTYADSVYRFINRFDLQKMAQSKWLGMMNTTNGRPYMHPPTFFIILAGWMFIFGNSMLSATVFMWISTAIWGVACYYMLISLKSKAPVFLALLFITLSTTIQDTWFPIYDVFAGMFLMLGYGLFILAIRKNNHIFQFLSGLALGISSMLRLTSLFCIFFILIALVYLVLRRYQPIKSLLINLLGFMIFPLALFIAGYNPLLTLITANFRQINYYSARAVELIKQLPVFLYLGIPLLVLLGFGIFKDIKNLVKNINGLFILILVLTTIPMAYATKLSPDFQRNMLGVNACFILAISLLDNWPKSKWNQSILIGINLAFVFLTMVF